jgi:hypothetical protein
VLFVGAPTPYVTAVPGEAGGAAVKETWVAVTRLTA